MKKDNILFLAADTEKVFNEKQETVINNLRKGEFFDLASFSAENLAFWDARFKGFCIYSEKQELLTKLQNLHPFYCESKELKIIFSFSGLGNQHVDMGKTLYLQYDAFRKSLDYCFKIIESVSGLDLLPCLYPTEIGSSENELSEITIYQFVVFAFEYAMGQFLIELGLRPDFLVGYSFGEYLCACFSEMATIEDIIRMLYIRGGLVCQTQCGRMLSVPIDKKTVREILGNSISIGIDNGESCILSDEKSKIDEAEMVLKIRRILGVEVNGRYGFHSPLMEWVGEAYEEALADIEFKAPQIPFLSNVTGSWFSIDEFCIPEYWSRQLKHEVLFHKCLTELNHIREGFFVDIGSGNEIGGLLTRHRGGNNKCIVSVAKRKNENIDDIEVFTKAIIKLWENGINMNYLKWWSINQI